MTGLPPWITERRFADLLGWSPGALIRQRAEDRPPGNLAHYQGRNVRYTITVVLDYFDGIGGEPLVDVIIARLRDG